MKMLIGNTARALLLVLLSALMISGAKADAVEDFYKGKVVTLYVGYTAGGAFDVIARAIAPYLQKHIPGNPAVIVSNMPGAGSLNLVNQIDKVLPADGTAIGSVARSIVVDKLLGRNGTDYDARAINWIGSTTKEISVCAVWHTKGITSLEEFLNQELVFGATAPGSETEVYSKLVNAMLGANIQVITGFPGANEIDLAIERGEVDGRCGWTWASILSTRLAWFEEKQIYVALQLAPESHPDLVGVPLIGDIVKTDEEREILELILSQQVMGRPYIAPPGVPEDRVAALKKAFELAVNDPEFLALAAKQNLEISPITGDELQNTVENILDTPTHIVEMTKTMLQ